MTFYFKLKDIQPSRPLSWRESGKYDRINPGDDGKNLIDHEQLPW